MRKWQSRIVVALFNKCYQLYFFTLKILIWLTYIENRQRLLNMDCYSTDIIIKKQIIESQEHSLL